LYSVGYIAAVTMSDQDYQNDQNDQNDQNNQDDSQQKPKHRGLMKKLEDDSDKAENFSNKVSDIQYNIESTEENIPFASNVMDRF